MRRKRLVIVAAAASALLLTGGIAATSAGAEETPDVPGLPGFTMPDLFGWSQFGDSDDSADGDGSASGDAIAGDDDGDGSDVGGDDISGTAEKPGPDAGALTPVDPAQPAQQQPADRPKPAAAPQRPAPVRRPAPAQRPAPDSPGFAPQRPTSGLMAASREDVTAADISSSPNAPVQQQVLALINLNRRRHGCDAVSLDRRLIDAANEHAYDMARHDYFAHESRNGDGAGDRVSEAGYRWKRYGENIARGVDSAYEVVDGWMHSPEHRENILDCRLDQMGVGLAIAGDHTPYWVQDFATPMT
jgi:uncharacterized protein YkwD